NLLPAEPALLKPAPEFRSGSTKENSDREYASALPPFDPAAAWPHAKPVEPPQNPFWVMAPGSMAESRRWPIENFAATARMIHSQTGWKGLIVGGPSETKLATKLRKLAGDILSDWTARGTAASYWNVFRTAKFTLSNDSGLAHVAAICGLPGDSLVHVVWGAGVRERTQPLGPGRVQISFNAVACWPCERNLCFQPAEGKLKCLRGIEPAAVWKQIAQAIRLNLP
ncbi:MAG TPA: glycosyltransferase family 9 protein, partial [Verrucomicrobiae bacterium]|nr:glycosyltransferase family 9 protein [Verrucomicrobiae bacterium]